MAENLPRRQDNSALWIILAVVGGGLFVLMLLCGGIAYLWLSILRTGEEMVREAPQHFFKAVGEVRRAADDNLRSAQTAGAFLNDCLAGRLNAAYAATSAGFRKTMTAEQLKALLEEHPVRKGPAPVTVVGDPLLGPHQYRHTAAGPVGEQVIFSISMIREGDTWKVDQFALDGPVQAPKVGPANKGPNP